VDFIKNNQLLHSQNFAKFPADFHQHKMFKKPFLWAFILARCLSLCLINQMNFVIFIG